KRASAPMDTAPASATLVRVRCGDLWDGAIGVHASARLKDCACGAGSGAVLWQRQPRTYDRQRSRLPMLCLAIDHEEGACDDVLPIVPPVDHWTDGPPAGAQRLHLDL